MLAFVINKHKMPFSSSRAFMEFATSADPDSKVFSRMSSSRDTITRCTQDIFRNVLRVNLQKSLQNSLFWSVIADESTDSGTQEQLIIYVQFIDIEKQIVQETFLEVKEIVGHPDASNIFDSMMKVFHPE